MIGQTSAIRQYFLQSERLGFGHWTADDLLPAAAVWEDPDVMRLGGGPLTRTATLQRLALEMDNGRQHDLQYWPVFFRETGEHVGCCGLKPHDLGRGMVEFGCLLRRSCWSLGLGREAARAVLEYGFEARGMSAIRASHHPLNDASRCLLVTLGFRRTPDEFYPATGLMEPCYLLTRKDMPAGC